MTDRSTTLNEESSPVFFDRRAAQVCVYCEALIMWMYTRYGARMPFDAHLLPVRLDVDSTGWLPGLWPVGIAKRTRMVMAPVKHYGRLKRDRVTHVAVLHQCPQWKALRAEAPHLSVVAS